MNDWIGVALALRTPEQDRLQSRLPTYLHPLAGRAVSWHVLHSINQLGEKPERVLMATSPHLAAAFAGEFAGEGVVDTTEDWRSVFDRLDADATVLVVDAAAPLLDACVEQLVGGPVGQVLRADDGTPVAAWMAANALAAPASAETLDPFISGCDDAEPADASEILLVRDRASLAAAGERIRDRIVTRLMDGGASFLLPKTVMVDVDVVVEADAVVYPGVTLEGQTRIGAETVVGPGCRIIDSRVGRGVELKGWNYIVGTAIRNRAVLEPYVRRGFD